MDRRQGAVAVALLLTAAVVPALASQVPPLRAMRWLAPGADAVIALAWQPVECLKLPASNGVEIGRAAFRSPLLLGGQAARAGISCASCHRSGRGNPEFAFPGLSGPPGTADVTSSLFSSHRADAVSNPRPIPDLGRSRPGQLTGTKLSAFIHGLVVEEFNGAEPPPAVLAGLVAYLEAMRSSTCPAGTSERVTVATLTGDATRAVTGAEHALAQADRATATAMVLAARAALGLLDERFAGNALARERAGIRRADGQLGAAQAAIRRGDASAAAQLARWRSDAADLTRQLAASEAQSLFDPGVLAAATRSASATR